MFSSLPPPLRMKEIRKGMYLAAVATHRVAFYSAAGMFFVYVLPAELISQLAYHNRDYEEQSGRW